ncbi:MAG: hypothetical protein P9M06_01525 [Candidatus Saelkia tenebricola]|nr:hypothetical protein [Candidatus Saelkia tenebricola]
MSDSVKTVIYSLCGTLLSVSVISAVWLGLENRKIYSRYTEEKVLWYQTNRDLEFDLDKFKSEIEKIQANLNKYQTHLSKVEEEKLISENNFKELADENMRLRESVARLVREKNDVKASFTSQENIKYNNTGDDSFWSNLLREKSNLELRLSSLERLLEKKDSEISRFEKEKENLNNIVNDLLDKKENLENKFQDTKKIVSSLSASLEQEKKEKFSYIKQVEEMQRDKNTLQMKVAQAQDRKKEISERITQLEQNVEKEKKEKEIFNQRIGYINRVLEDEVLEVTKLKQDLEMALEKIKKLNYDTEGEAVELPRIEIKDELLKGRVVFVNVEEGFIIIDIGRRDGVQIGMGFSIYRGNTLIAKLQVIDVREVTSAASILLSLPKMQIAENDSVMLSD